MAWIYDADNPDATPRDEVRTLIHDVTQTEYSPSDERIAYWLGKYGDSVERAALDAAKFKRDKWRELHPDSRTVVGMTATVTSNPFDELVREMEAKISAGSKSGVQMFGLRRSEIREIERDSDIVRPFVSMGGDRNT